MQAKSEFHGVDCARCKNAIPVRAIERSVEEFSVPCTKCGRRGLFKDHDLKPQRFKAMDRQGIA